MPDKRTRKRDVARNLAILGGIGLLIVGALVFSNYLSNNQTAVDFIQLLGYGGVFIAAVIAGLNVIVPVPAATLTPLFLEAGLTVPLIIISLAVGTMVADLIGFMIGHTSRQIIEHKYPKILSVTNYIIDQHPIIISLFVTLYTAFVPLPNEIILIPLALSGVSLRLLIGPILIGAIVLQTLLVTGVSFFPTGL